MASAVTAATLKKTVAEDDFESQQKTNVRQPEMCVDYLSYTFDEMDLAASWRVMTKQKKDVVDGIRLENASWRTWAKQRNNLATISPQTLNWLKDSDVTWLYGPLHTVIRTEEDPFLAPRKATTEETLGLMIPRLKKKQPLLKSALKKITTTDLLKRSANELLQNNTTATATLENIKHHRKISISDVNNHLFAISPTVLANHRQPKLRFNHQVEQCIALTEEERENEDSIEEMDNISEGDEDTDEIITFHVSYASSRRKSIKKIAPARLKKSQSDADTDDVSSISSTSTASSVGFITRSPAVSSPVVDADTEEEEDKTVIKQSFYDRPINRPSSSSNLITRPYIAEPALVTMNQTATDTSRGDSTLFNNIATWAASYLWPQDNSNRLLLQQQQRPSPKPSVSAPIIPPTLAIPIERSFVPTSSNSYSL